MRKLEFPAAIAAVITVICKALDCGNEAATRLLMLTGLDYGRAAARAPLVCGLAVCIVGILCVCAWMSISDERDRRRRQYIDRTHARTEEPDYRPRRDD